MTSTDRVLMCIDEALLFMSGMMFGAAMKTGNREHASFGVMYLIGYIAIRLIPVVVGLV